MQTIREILGLDFLSLPFDNEDRKKYDANASGKRIGEVIIDGVKITGYSAFSFVRKLTYVKSPTRSGDGTIGNLNSYPVFTTPQLQIDFSLLGIDMYRKIMNLIYARREHLVQCYDIVRDEQVTERMYFEPEELPKLVAIARQLQNEAYSRVEILGVQDYVVTMVGTNVPNEIINIVYYDMNNNIIGSEQLVENTEIVIGEGVVVENIDGYKFNNYWDRETSVKTRYVDKIAYSVVLEGEKEIASRTISFKAVYKDDREYTLSFSYGLGEATRDIYNKEIVSIPFVVGDTYADAIRRANITLANGTKMIGLQKSPNPQITDNGITYTTHLWNGWFRTSSKTSNTKEAVQDTHLISVENDTIIYQLFNPIQRTISFKDLYFNIEVADIKVTVGEKPQLPKFANREYNGETWEHLGWTLKGKDELFESIITNDITLYAKWVVKQ